MIKAKQEILCRAGQRALKHLARQPYTPLSPGRLHRGRYLLCGGAALVSFIAAEIGGQRERRSFLRSVRTTGSSEAIIEGIAKYGLPEIIAEQAVAKNDAAVSNMRLAKLKTHFETLGQGML